MKITSVEQRKLTNLFVHLIYFLLFIGFSFSTIDKTSENSNITFERNKFYLGDLSVLENKYLFDTVCFLLENQKESIENFNETLIYKLIEKIFKKIQDHNYAKISMKEINIILNIIILKMDEISEINFNNEFFYISIFYLTGIYTNHKNNDLNFKNFNEKIIRIISKKIYYEIKDSINIKNNSTKLHFLKNYICVLKFLAKKKFFYINLENNKKLKEHMKKIFLVIKFFKKRIDNI